MAGRGLLPLCCLLAALPALPARRARPAPACDCHGMSRQCVFDWQLLQETGNGFRCLGCGGNTAGPRCERCRDGFFRQREGNCCLPCHCHPQGSLSPQCDSNGQCSCKPGVMGEKCDQCQPGFESLSEAGCQRSGQSLQCECDPAGSLGTCLSGHCVCKERVTGEHCERCKGNFYNLDARNPVGCSPCFCYGHSAACVSADNYSAHNITSTFQQGAEGWRGVQEGSSPAQLQWSPRHRDVFLTARSSEPTYFVAPAKFLGNQQLSYSQTLSFDYRLDRGGLHPSLHDVVLEGDGLRVTAPFLPQGEVLPCGVSQTYTFRLDEHPSSSWSPRLSHLEYRRLLGNLTGLWIRATFGEYSTGYLDNVTLGSAQPGAGAPAPWVEQCECPAGHGGQFCQKCAPGFHRDVPSLGPFSGCVPCNCRGGGICDPDTGECYSGDEDVGNSVSCPFGSYRDPRQPQGCRACPCSNGQGCSVVPGSEEVFCDQCPPGAAGANCEYCADGYFGDPAASRPCRPCQCHGNVEPNAVGNCDRQTGECLKCIHNTAGSSCHRCRDGFFGNPLAPDPADKCRACHCNPYGTVNQQTSCNQVTGQCECLSHVTGRDCSACEPGFFNLQSGRGCERCNCHALGSTNGQCDIQSGQCECQPGVAGQRCDACEVNHFGFSSQGCKPCDCDPEGSRSLQCRENGRCDCKEGFVGSRCDQCEENYFYNRSWPGCQECPACYRLVKDKVAEQRERLQELENLIANLGMGEDTVTDQAFEERLKQAERDVTELLQEAQNSKDVDQGLMDRLKDINSTLASQLNRLRNIQGTVQETENMAERARVRVEDTEDLISLASDMLEKAKMAADNVSITPPESTGDPNNMTLLAEEARKLAERHKKEADEIVRTAKAANETSTEAYQLLLKTLAGENQTANDIDELNLKYNQARNISRDLEKQANKVLAEAEEAGNKALQIYANLTSLPTVDSTGLENEANKIKKEAEELDQLIARKLKDYEDLREDMKGKELEVKNLLEKGKTEQQTADQLLARADAAKALAEEAARKGNGTLQEANTILSNLKDFDKRVNDNKTAAEEALKKIPAISQTIAEANDKTRQAELALGTAAADAREAKAKADDAEKIASSVQKSAAATKTEADKTFADVTGLAREVDDMMKQLQDAEKELKRKQDDAEQDMMMAGMASQAAQEAEDNARKAKNSVNSLLAVINDLLDQLGQLETVDLNKLNEIEGTLNSAKDQMKDSDLDQKVSFLEREARKQDDAIQAYNRDIEEILKDISNLEDIKKTLPSGCFNTPSIEKP